MYTPNQFHETARTAAREGGAILKQYFETDLAVQFKEDNTVVTRADTESERAVRTIIEQAFPDHAILGEEEGLTTHTSPYRWIIDPLDGTANFVNSIPLFAVSVALEHDGVLLASAVYNPITDSLYSAERGGGVLWNDRPVHVSENTNDTAMISLGQSTRTEDRTLAKKLFVHADQYVKRVRHLASASLELAYVARGGTEGYINLGTKPWDYAAGYLLVQEAGGTITRLDGTPCDHTEPYFIASNGIIHPSLIRLVHDVQHVK
jgi:myo-inositol-1(or 4)-monophosphatase